jgi:NAD(P)-dependent dehydrogenase (short-subunit alcohol dehydrogenase family)
MQSSNVTLRQRNAAVISPEVGRLAVVTCSSCGIGFDIALALAQSGADVIIAGPRQTEGHSALAKIRPLAPQALVRFEKLDLESLSSVADFAARLNRADRPVDLLINNACTLALLKRQVTRDRFELHFAANYVSHFALTARLLPLLRGSKRPRVVQLTSTGRHHGEIHLDDLQLEREYTPLKAYSQSKLAMLIFALELQRQSEANGWGITASAAQPIGSREAQLTNSSEVTGSQGWYRRALGVVLQHHSGGSAERSSEHVSQGTLLATETKAPPQSSEVKALTDLIGPPVPEALDMRALDPAVARVLWETSTQLAKVTWPYI